MVARVKTVAFQGIEAIPVDVQVMVAPGKMGIQIVGAEAKTENGEVHDHFQIEVQNADQVTQLFQNLAAVPGVTSVQRLTDISTKSA